MRTKNVRVALLAAAMMLPAVPSMAQTDWDDPDRRGGFVIGFGAGPGFTRVGSDETLGSDESQWGGAIDFRIGAEAGSTLIFFLSQSTLMDGDDFLVDDAVVAGFSGLGVSVAATNRLFVTAGVGVGSWTEICFWFCGSDRVDETGFGAMAGVGYEFADLWIVDLSGNFAALDAPGNVFSVSMKLNILSH